MTMSETHSHASLTQSPKQDYVQGSTPKNDDDKTFLAVDTTENEKKYNFFSVYRYGSKGEIALLILGFVAAAVQGALWPCMALIYGDSINSFATASSGVDMDAIKTASLKFLGLAIGLFIVGYISTIAFKITSERMVMKLRVEALKSVLRQEIGYFDQAAAAQLSSRISGDTEQLKEGISSKLGEGIRYTAQFITGYIIGFTKGWNMALYMLAVVPLTAVSIIIVMSKAKKGAEISAKMYAKAGAVAEDALGSMRTVASLNAEQKIASEYESHVNNVRDTKISQGKVIAISVGIVFGSIWITYGVGLWAGAHFVSTKNSAINTPGDVFSVFFGILIGTISLAQISPALQAVGQAQGAAKEVLKILDRESTIDPLSDQGVIPDKCDGQIQVKNVRFSYPSRPDVQVLRGYNVTIESGQTVAFVGESGSGKSTIVGLIQRFYNPDSGTILVDGQDISSLNLRWLRGQIGIVSQEPVLFNATIYENIVAGAPNKTKDDVIEAAKMANANELIMRLPNGYDSMVGEGGVSLSGGQKQRIALARALVRKPKILILDEATSALDAESESIVQDALNRLMKSSSMSTIVIAHRLSTVRDADKIVVLNQGEVEEEGSHDSLMGIENGIYRNLVEIQEGTFLGDDEDDEKPRHKNETANVSSKVEKSDAIGVSDVEGSKVTGAGEGFSWKRLLAINKPEIVQYLLGLGACVVLGFSMPGSGLLVSHIVTSMNTDYAKYLRTLDDSFLHSLYVNVRSYCYVYLGASVAFFLFTWIQHNSFNITKEALTARLRSMQFRAYLRKDIGFFDRDENATGNLTASINTDSTKVASITGESQGRMLQNVATFIFALFITFGLGSWQLSLLLLAVFPILVGANMMNARKWKVEATNRNGDSGARVTEAIRNVRTVAAFGLEEKLVNEYTSALGPTVSDESKRCHKDGLVNGLADFVVFATYAIAFYYGGWLVNREAITLQQMMNTLMAVMMSAQGIGQNMGFITDAGSAKEAAAKIFRLIDSVPTIDSASQDGIKEMPQKSKDNAGNIAAKSIEFAYPTRPNIKILDKFSLNIESGQTVAFCGPSGGGKSTIVSLLERFYDPLGGDIMLDGVSLKDYNLKFLRDQMGLVGQEPVLFNGTIADNLRYGLEGATREQMIEACKMSNAHGYISNFPDGYDTHVGTKGHELSGGQKQRIAIARAILKDPSILLLDEATSALDSESERIVQEALDKLLTLRKRTTLIIAHRLSTIRNADKICVISGGSVAECGTDAELLALGGLYAELVSHGDSSDK